MNDVSMPYPETDDDTGEADILPLPDEDTNEVTGEVERTDPNLRVAS